MKVTEIILDEEPGDVLKDEPQHVPVKKAKKTIQAKPEREVVCVQCGKKFSAKLKKKNFVPVNAGLLTVENIKNYKVMQLKSSADFKKTLAVNQ